MAAEKNIKQHYQHKFKYKHSQSLKNSQNDKKWGKNFNRLLPWSLKDHSSVGRKANNGEEKIWFLKRTKNTIENWN